MLAQTVATLAVKKAETAPTITFWHPAPGYAPLVRRNRALGISGPTDVKVGKKALQAGKVADRDPTPAGSCKVASESSVGFRLCG